MTEQIDIVIPWVDGSDPEWQAQKALYTGKHSGDDSVLRYRDWDNLQYVFRGIEEFLPWVRKVHFVTWGHLPSWLNVNSPKLNIVKHTDYIPEKYLPTFSSHVIELNFHLIEDLSEQFIYINDDFFFLKPLKPEFFFKNGLPVDCCMEIPHQFFCGQIDHIIGENLAVINSKFPKRATILKQWKKWFSLKQGKATLKNLYMMPFACFCGFYNPHVAASYLKSTWKEVWESVPQVLDKTSSDRIRAGENVNQWLFRYWQFVTGKYSPSKLNRGRFFSIGRDDEQIEKAILSRTYPMVCLSDDDINLDFETEKEKIKGYLETILPNKSSFEI